MTVVYSYYVLDLIHNGHLLQLQNAKRLVGADGRSVVGILTDEAVMEKKSKPALSFEERMRIAQAVGCVDLVVPQTTYSPLPNVWLIRPDVLMESASHSDGAIEEARRCMAEIGGRLIVTPYYPSQSSTHIKNGIRNRNGG